MGASVDEAGANFAVFSENAEQIDLCLYAPNGVREIARLPLPERTGAIWHGHVAGLEPGALYGFRAHGVWAPERGHRFNPAKLLLDPYARALSGPFDPTSALLIGHDPVFGEGVRSNGDSAPAVPKCVLTPDPEPYGWDERPNTPWEDTLIYEAHVKGLTELHPEVPEALRGTYEGLACPAIIEHLTSLGATAVELLPVHAFMDDGRLLMMGLRNYWGYNSIGFFALEPRYFGPNGIDGFRKTVKTLHAAGIEVILDVVYNHTAEGDHRGPTVSFRGLDNACYYRLQQGRSRRYVNDTGCGNTLNTAHPFVLRLVLDSLRWWVERMGVDGFRFDLGTALAREVHGFNAEGGFLDALRQDPVLNRVKLIAEPWDIGPGGYQLGGWPPPFAEWNDQFRDTARKFWRRDAHAAQDLAERLLGSAGLFDKGGRRAWSSVNFVACHDGFTLADVTAYNEKHNAANGEDNRDGHGDNHSDNCGREGPTDDPVVMEKRGRRRRNLLATLLLSQGAPMLLAGDEIANSQSGNNNAYCQDNEIGWVDWPNADADLLAFTRRLTAFRRRHGVVRQSLFLHGETRPEDGKPDVAWRAFDGGAVDWRDPTLDRFCLLLRGSAEAPGYATTEDAVLIAFNGRGEPASLHLPAAPAGCVWTRALDTADADAPVTQCAGEALQEVFADSIAAFALERIA
ncbi:MAG: glycogen debranching enzyme GlgX [Rhodobacteraceae bacterium]|nr:MAG: glycogen debranching enzyme GlgX [Paracoccaceae bacterium]